MTKQIEVQRHNVNLAEFINYVKKMCAKKGLEMGYDREYLENPCGKGRSSSYHIKDGMKYCYIGEYRTHKEYYRIPKSYVDENGKTRYYISDEIGESHKEVLEYFSQVSDAEEGCTCRFVTRERNSIMMLKLSLMNRMAAR